MRWPREADLRQRLAGEARARLLVVDEGAAPPQVTDLLEDWVWSSADQSETRARMETLAHRASSSQSEPPTLGIDTAIAEDQFQRRSMRLCSFLGLHGGRDPVSKLEVFSFA